MACMRGLFGHDDDDDGGSSGEDHLVVGLGNGFVEMWRERKRERYICFSK